MFCLKNALLTPTVCKQVCYTVKYREKCISLMVISLLSQKHVSSQEEMRPKQVKRTNAWAIAVRRGTARGHSKITSAHTPAYWNTWTATEGKEKESLLVLSLNFGHARLYLSYWKHNSNGHKELSHFLLTRLGGSRRCACDHVSEHSEVNKSESCAPVNGNAISSDPIETATPLNNQWCWIRTKCQTWDWCRTCMWETMWGTDQRCRTCVAKTLERVKVWLYCS